MRSEKIIRWSQLSDLPIAQWNTVPGLGQVRFSQSDMDFADELGGDPDVVLVERTAGQSRMKQYVVSEFIPRNRVQESKSNASASFDQIFMEPEQEDLLAALVMAYRHVPRNERQDFKFHIALVHKGYHSRQKMHEILDNGGSVQMSEGVITRKEDIPWGLDHDIITHPGLSDSSIDTHLNDVDALRLQNLICFRDEERFFISPQGFAYIKLMSRTRSPNAQEKIQQQSTVQQVEVKMDESSAAAPRAFISYSWDSDEHREWVRDLAARLRGGGVDVTLDRWHTIPGDQLPAFMERSIRENDYVLIVCTPKFKEKSDNRTGGVGCEGDIMTGEVFTRRNDRKFIPLLRSGEWKEAAPSWLAGKYYIDLRGQPYFETHYDDLRTTLLGNREQAPPLGVNVPTKQPDGHDTLVHQTQKNEPQALTDPIKVLGIIVDSVTVPNDDGTRGSGLYSIPFQLSRQPSSKWAEFLVETWNHPPQWSTMHRPGIASVQGDRLVLDGTTIDEVEIYHRKTLKLVIERTNFLEQEHEQSRQQEEQRERQRVQDHAQQIKEAANRLKFD